MNLHVDMSPLTNMMYSMVLYMLVPAIVYAIIFRKLPKPIFNLLLYLVIFGGGYAFFKF